MLTLHGGLKERMGGMESSSILGRCLLTVIAMSIAMALSGCVGGDSAAPEDPSEPSGTLSSTPSPSSSPHATAQAEPGSVPVKIACDSVISAQTMYDFNPNFALLANFTPEPGSAAAQAQQSDGTVCRWINQTSGDTVDVSIARPSSDVLEVVRREAEIGTQIHGLGVEAYFSSAGDVGTAHAFPGSYWVTVSSVYFSTGADAQRLLAEAVADATQ